MATGKHFRKLIVFIVLIIALVQLSAQETYILFRPEVNGTTIDSIQVNNLRTDQKVMLSADDTLYLTKISSVVIHRKEFINTYALYPNPNEGEATLHFRTLTPGNVNLDIYTTGGQLVNRLTRYLPVGLHRFGLRFAGPGIFSLSLLHQKKIRLV